MKKKAKGKNRRMSQSEETLKCFRKIGEGGQWEDGYILDVEEFGEMTQRTRRERADWVSRIAVKFGVVESEGSGEGLRKERDDWSETEMEGKSWRQRRGNWWVKERRVRRLGFGRLKGEKDGSRGEGRGRARPG